MAGKGETDKKLSLWEQAQELHRDMRENWQNYGRWNLWPEASSDYPEFSVPFQEIADHLGLDQIVLDLEAIHEVFPDDMPLGGAPKDPYRHDAGHRRGAYIAYRGDGFTIVVHAFYKNAKREITCWRGRLVRDRDGKRFDMPRKPTEPGTKPHMWCERFRWCFLTDLESMIGRALNT